eukprot:439569-Hanusia_phi.AAC.2
MPIRTEVAASDCKLRTVTVSETVSTWQAYSCHHPIGFAAVRRTARGSEGADSEPPGQYPESIGRAVPGPGPRGGARGYDTEGGPCSQGFRSRVRSLLS